MTGLERNSRVLEVKRVTVDFGAEIARPRSSAQAATLSAWGVRALTVVGMSGEE